LRAMLQAATYDVNENKQTADQDALQRLKRDYLPQWAALAYGSAVGKGFPGEVPYVDYMKGGVSTGETIDEPDNWVCNIIEKGIEELTPRIPMARAALSSRYVRGASEPTPAVYRSMRTAEPTKLYWIDDIADLAEKALVPLCRRRGLPI
jgi:hypothetical protein